MLECGSRLDDLEFFGGRRGIQVKVVRSLLQIANAGGVGRSFVSRTAELAIELSHPGFFAPVLLSAMLFTMYWVRVKAKDLRGLDQALFFHRSRAHLVPTCLPSSA